MKIKWIACLLLLLAASQSFAAGNRETDLTIKNWANHPSIVVIRNMYKDINAKRKSGQYKTEGRRFNVRASQCGPEPIRSMELVRDEEKRVRLFIVINMGKQGEPYIVNRYYDENGMLRFVSSGGVMTSDRLYLDKSGRVFWSLNKDFMKYRLGKMDNSSKEASPLRSKDVLPLFNAAQSCPVIND